MNCRFIVTINMASGDYEVEFKNVDDPEEGIDYFEFMRTVRAVLKDMDGRMEEERSAVAETVGEDEEVKLYVYGDDHSVN